MRRLEDFFRTGGVISSGVGICRTCRTAKGALVAELGRKRAMEAAEGPSARRPPLLRRNYRDNFLMVNEGMFPLVS